MAWTNEQLDAIYKDGQNIIVSAGAGSGKTTVLSERILEKIKKGVSIDSLLVLTFTNAAAFEMKDRIKKKIYNEPSTRHLANEVDSAYITTFDSYALSIVKKYHYLLGIDKNITLIDSSIIDLYKSNVLDEIFENLYKEKNEVFLDLISKSCNKDDKDLKKELLEINKKLDLKINKIEFLKSYPLNYFNSSFYNKIYDEYEDFIFNILELSKEYYDSLIESLDEKNLAKCNDYYDDIYNSTSVDDLIFALSKKSPSLKNLDESQKKIKEILNKIFTKIKKDINDLPLKNDFINLSKDNEKYIQIIIDILLELDEKVSLYKNKNLAFEFSDIAKMSIKCLKDNPDELNKLKYSLNEILLDEYQDTSDLQEEFISLIGNNNVYMVGDIKQSIYRFRNANPSIFMNKYENYKINNGGLKIDLMKNFRSRQEVVDAVNLVFNPIMSLNLGGADYKKDHTMHFGNEDYNKGGKVDTQSFKLECYNYNVDKDKKYDNNDVEIFFMAKDIINKINNKYLIMDKVNNVTRPLEYKDIAILIDKSKEFDTITKIFTYFNIPSEIIKNDDFTTNSLIHTFSNILNLVNLENSNIYDADYKLSFMSVARSFIINMSDDELSNIILDNSIKNTFIYQKILKISNNISIKSNSMLIEEIINEFDIINKLPLIGGIEQNLMRIEHIYNLANNYSSLGLNGDLFITKLQEVLDNELKIEIEKFSNNDNSVKILTIHKSKGLEYPLVYLPFITSKFFSNESRSDFLYTSKYHISLPVFNDEFNSLTKYLHLKNEKLETISEKIRLFYVALTRARDKLIIIRQNSSYENDLNEYNLSNANSINDLLNSIGEILIPYTKDIDVDNLGISKDYIYFIKNKIKVEEINNPIEHRKINVNSELIENVHSSKEVKDLIDSKTLENMQYGTKMHEIMESIDLINPNFDGIEEWMIKHIKFFLSLDILKEIENAKIYKEYEFSFGDKKRYHGIIDLLIEFDDRILIIDYKLNNIDNEEYINQLSSYKDYIKSLNLNKNIHMYLFSFLEDKIKEI